MQVRSYINKWLAVPLETEDQRWNYRYCTIEGCLAVASVQAVASFVVVYAIDLGASNSQVGLLISLPFLVTALTILAGSRFISRRHPQKPTMIASAIHRVFVVMMVFAPLLPMGIRVWWVTATYSLAATAAALASTWWTAMMSEVFPQKHRGAVFGTRSVFTGSAGVIATLLTGRGLDLLPFPYNYMLMFLVAAIVGFIASSFIAKLRLPVEPTVQQGTEKTNVTQLRLRWRQVLQGDTKTAFWGLALPVFLFNMGYHMATPIINIYFVEYLHYSKSAIGLLTAIFLICQVLSSRFWGRLCDRIGNHIVALISMAILTVQMSVYLLVPRIPFLLLMQSMGGLAFGGYAISTFNGLINMGSPAQRSVLVSLFNVVSQMGAFLAPSSGTFILDQWGLVVAFVAVTLFRAIGALSIAKPARREQERNLRIEALHAHQLPNAYRLRIRRRIQNIAK